LLYETVAGRHKLGPYLPASITEIVCYFVINFSTPVASDAYTSEMFLYGLGTQKILS